MANMINNIGMSDLFEEKDLINGTINFIVQTGKPFGGYSNSLYFYKDMGSSELWATTLLDNETKSINYPLYNKRRCYFSFPTYLVGFIIAPLSPQYNKIFQNLFFVKTTRSSLSFITLPCKKRHDYGSLLPSCLFCHTYFYACA